MGSGQEAGAGGRSRKNDFPFVIYQNLSVVIWHFGLEDVHQWKMTIDE
jgi:hypothetical protein